METFDLILLDNELSANNVDTNTLNSEPDITFLPNKQPEENHGEVTLSRDRKQTPKFAEWQLETYERNFKSSVSTWRRNATQLEKLMCDSKCLEKLRTERDKFETYTNNVTENYEKLINLGSSTGNCSTTYEQLEQDNFQLMKQMAECIRSLELDRCDTATRSSRKTKSSRSSTHSSKHVEAVAEAAALKAKLKHINRETQARVELEQARVELEQKKMELERTQTLKEYDMAQAKAEAIVSLDMDVNLDPEIDLHVPNTSKEDLVSEFVQKHTSSTHMDETQQLVFTDVGNNMLSHPSHPYPQETELPKTPGKWQPTLPPKEFIPRNNQGVTYQAHKPTLPAEMDVIPVTLTQTPVGNIQSNQTRDETVTMLKLLTEQVNLNRLTPPEPGIFYGDPLSYPSWKAAFQTLIARREIPDCEKIYYLKKYLGGQAKEAVEGYLLLSTNSAYSDAIGLLESRYGDNFVIANAFRNKLDEWPKIPPRDGVALRRLSDFLRQCELAMNIIPSLQVLSDDRENRKILMKLPDWLTLRWSRIVSDWREKHHTFPPFSEFSAFIAKEAAIACDPVTSFHSLKPVKAGEGNRTSGKIDRSRTTEQYRTSYVTETNTSAPTPKKNEKSCLMCKGSHGIDVCETFLLKSLQERKDFAMERGLCFGCMNKGHRSKDCNQRKTCTICSKKHPTCYHGDYRKSEKTDPKNAKTVTNISKTVTDSGISHMVTGNSCKCSMIVPVWVFRQDSPNEETMVYALLDTQSDTTFILDQTCNELQVDGPDVLLSLSAMTSVNQQIPCKRIEGLLVRGYDSSLRIQLPATYSREMMPSNRMHIPTPEVARKWPHLEQIADKIMPLCDADVGLLIGYNCSQALVPRKVIASTGNEPYGQMTDLGWGIVGIINPDDEDTVGDAFGLSHRTLCSNVIEPNTGVRICLQDTIKEVISPLDVTKLTELDFSERYTEKISSNKLPEHDLQLQSDDLEVKHAKVLATLSDTPSRSSLLKRLEHLSDWHKVRRAVSVCLRLKTRLKARDAKPPSDVVKRSAYESSTVGELLEAETLVIKLVQEASFKKEIDILHSLPNKTVNKRGDKHLRGMRRKSPLYKLDPFLDAKGVLRVGGRIRSSSHPDELEHPVILPKKHHITILIIRHFHEREQHQGRGITCNAIRSGGFWIIGGRSEVSHIISKCTTCRKFRAQTTAQKMSNLPEERIEPSPPFTHCGVDYFGPWTIKEGRKLLSRYGVIFTCLSSRAVHIETAISLSSDSFINALRRFIAIRGPIRQLRSDRGTNFVGASRELREAVQEMDHDKVKQYLLSENCDYFEFRMNPPAASHMGGAWERQIRTIRSVLCSLMKQCGEQLDDESLRTLMCEVSAIINCRPLTTDNISDAHYPEPLTPNHILTMKSKVILPPPGNFIREDLYCRKRWRRVQHIANSFWSRWKKEYLHQLQVRQKWTQVHRNIQVGDVVIVKDSQLPRNKWQLARVEETFPSSDGHVRSVKLLIADSQLDNKGKRLKPVMRLERPVHKLVLLLQNE